MGMSNGGSETMPIEAKAAAFAALSADAVAAQRGQPQHVVVFDARQILYSTQRKTEKVIPGKLEKQQIPDRLTIAVPPGVLRSLAGDPRKAKKVVLLQIIDAEVIREIERRVESPIVTPEQDRAERAARMVRP